MAKADFNPKVSSIPLRGGPVAGRDDPKPFKNQSARADSYASAGADPYKALLSGQPKAETTPIQEMLGTDGSALPVNPSKRDLTGMDIFLEGFLMGDNDPGKASAADYEDVYVPPMHTLLRTGIKDDIHALKGIRDRYEGLKVTLENLIANAEATLGDPQTGYIMTTDQIEALSAHKKELEKKLFFLEQQLEKSNFYLDWAEKGAEEAKEKLKAEAEWWNEE